MDRPFAAGLACFAVVIKDGVVVTCGLRRFCYCWRMGERVYRTGRSCSCHACPRPGPDGGIRSPLCPAKIRTESSSVSVTCTWCSLFPSPVRRQRILSRQGSVVISVSRTVASAEKGFGCDHNVFFNFESPATQPAPGPTSRRQPHQGTFCARDVHTHQLSWTVGSS